MSKGRGGGGSLRYVASWRRTRLPPIPAPHAPHRQPRCTQPITESLVSGGEGGTGSGARREGGEERRNGDRFLLSREARATLSPLGARPAPLIPPPEAASLHAGSPRTGPDGGGGLTSGAKLGARGRVLLLPPAERMGGRGRPVLPSARAHLRRSLLGDGAGSHGGGGGTAGVGRTVGKRNGGEGKKQQSVPPLSFFSLQLQRQPRWPAHPHQGRQDALAVGPV